MDPFSVTVGYLGLVTTIAKVSTVITLFVKDVRQSRSDLDGVSRELTSLRTVLELLVADESNDAITFPETLSRHVSGIVANCNSVVLDIESCIGKYRTMSLRRSISWATSGRDDISKLLRSLEAHKAALELGLDMLALHLARDIKADTNEIRNDTTLIKEDTALILQEIEALKARLPDNARKAADSDIILQRYLEEMTTYTEAELGSTSSAYPDFPAIQELDQDAAFDSESDVESLAGLQFPPELLLQLRAGKTLKMTKTTDRSGILFAGRVLPP